MPEETDSSPSSTERTSPSVPDEVRGSTGHETESDLPVDSKSGMEVSGRPKTEFERKLGMTNTIFQIIAITIAGCFALWKFGLEERPTLQDHLKLTGSMNWSQQEKASCIADVDIDATNLSKANIEISKVRGSAWFIVAPDLNGKGISYFSPEEEVSAVDPAKQISYTNGPLVQRYVPGQSAHHTFEWVVERKDNQYVVIRIEAYRTGDENPIDVQTQWGPVCENDKEKEPSVISKKAAQ
jgi:hypothetical protein